MKRLRSIFLNSLGEYSLQDTHALRFNFDWKSKNGLVIDRLLLQSRRLKCMDHHRGLCKILSLDLFFWSHLRVSAGLESSVEQTNVLVVAGIEKLQGWSISTEA
jgi:hypothetical protein